METSLLFFYSESDYKKACAKEEEIVVSKEKTIFVYDDFSMQNPTLMGILYVNSLKGEESYSFEYDREWLKKTSRKITLDPALMP